MTRHLMFGILAGAVAYLGALVPARAEVGAYLLFDFADGEVIAQHNASTPWYPASLTKLMTAHVTFQAIEDGELKATSPVRISAQASQQPPSKMGFPVGTVLTIETALRIIMTKSANDVSVALAEAVGGTQGEFIARMNDTSRRLGMLNTTFDNPHGLPNTKQVTTARDMAILMMDLFERYDAYADYFDMSGVMLGNRRLRNHNKLVRQFRGTTGMKTGFICASGFNLAASARRNELHLGAVVLGGLTSQERDERTAELLAKGFEAVENGGTVAFDAFDDMDDRLAIASVEGEREAMGTVAALPTALPGADAVDRRAEVCGNARPTTRYSVGTVTSEDAARAQRNLWLEHRMLEAGRATARARILNGPRVTMVPVAESDAEQEEGSAEPLSDQVVPDGFQRALADDALRDPSHTPVQLIRAVPIERPAPPRRPLPQVATADFAPDWTGAVALPAPNPFEVADLRGPLPELPPLQPLTYLDPVISKAYVPISLGGADDERPEPLSGPVVGGGAPPLPKTKPNPIATDESATTTG